MQDNLKDIDVNIFAKRPTTEEDVMELIERYGEKEEGYNSIRCSFEDPTFTAVFVEAEDERVSLSFDEAYEALENMYTQLPKKVAKKLKRRLATGSIKPYARKEGFDKDGRVLSHGVVFTSRAGVMRVTIRR